MVPLSHPLSVKKRKLPVPKSLSILDMMKLGKEVRSSTEPIELFCFELETLVWSRNPTIVEFKVESDPFGAGGFRNAYKATSLSSLDGVQNWVVKKYLRRAVDVIKKTNQTTGQHTKKVVQMHMLARNFGLKLEADLGKFGKLEEYGPTLQYKKLILGKLNDEFVTLEEDSSLLNSKNPSITME